jgi:hypothetical protein
MEKAVVHGNKIDGRTAETGQERRFRDVSGMSAFNLIAAMADRGRRFGKSLSVAPKRKRPGHQLRAQFQSSNFGTHTKTAVIVSLRASA